MHSLCRHCSALILFLVSFGAAVAGALDDRAQVPVLLYHPQVIGERCDADDTDVLAMRRDLQLLRDLGFTPTPARRIVEWRLGLRSGSTLPARPVVITTDDGHNRNYLRTRHPARPCAADLPSVREIAEEFDAHVTMFVIASPAVRARLSAGYNSDIWWFDAERHPLLSVQNHSADHEHQALAERVFDPALDAHLPAAGHADGRWRGEHDPLRWSTHAAADVAVARAGRYIGGLTGYWPDFFAHPFGLVSPYLEQLYLPAYPREHEIAAAFCTEGRPERFVTRRSPIFCLPRLTRGYSWRSATEFTALLDQAR